MSLAKNDKKGGRTQKSPGSLSIPKTAISKQVNRSSQEMIRFLIDDYQAGTLKLGDDGELREKVESLKDDNDWETLAPEVRALVLVNALKHRVKES